ncbi:P-loop containing nucleoside triphosphate hydrolase protein [Periconia macrospinosa]|uniref:P-loop containing nucleoside triphosphate hydrolase protein n=1 Tax=Periconia macrospinosa TaxID=97972 RepID=A0A2V1DKD7_9PLEO|nr:P-loop containing nucleoside triphosphate hydrolase protein [Periconia macrospinosa]
MSDLLEVAAIQAKHGGTLQPKKEPFLFKLVVIGARKVGKTALIKKFVDGEFPVSNPTTQEERFRRSITLENQKYILEITDTGSENTWKDETIKGAHGFLLVYDLCKKSTFEKIAELHDKIHKADAAAGNLSSTQPHPTPPAVFVVGNKLDRTDEREVSTEDGSKEAERLGCKFREVTGKTNVEWVFLAVVKLGVQRAIKRRELSSSSRDMGVTSEGGTDSWLASLALCLGIDSTVKQ